MEKSIRIDESMQYTQEWNEFLISLSNKYGTPSELIWISKKRGKYVLEFADAKTLVINGEEFSFDEILSCSIENAMPLQKKSDIASDPHILVVRTSCNTNMLIGLTVWSDFEANAIYTLLQKIIKQNRQ